jgi:hypothetical protein
MSPAHDQRRCCNHLWQRWVLFLETQFELLRIIDSGANVNDFVNRNRLAQSSAAMNTSRAIPR